MPEKPTPPPSSAEGNGFYPITHQFGFDNPIEVTEARQRGINPESDDLLDQREQLQDYHSNAVIE